MSGWFSFQWYWRWMILVLSSSAADVSFSNVRRLLRSPAFNGRQKHPASSIGWRDCPAVTEAGRGASPEPPRSGDAGDPITISDGSGGDWPSKDARPMDEELEASPVARRTPWPIGLHSVEERRKKEEEEREQEPRQQLQEEQQQPRWEGGEEKERRHWQQGERLKELLEQN